MLSFDEGNVIEYKENLFYVLNICLGQNFIYGGIADLGWPNTLSYSGLSIPIFNETFQYLTDGVLSILQRDSSATRKFRFIEYMSTNKIKSISIKIEGNRIEFIVQKYSNEKTTLLKSEDTFYKRMNIPEMQKEAFDYNLQGYIDASLLITNKECFFYIIRPSIDSLLYNGAVYITSSRYLLEPELNFVQLYLSGLFTPVTIKTIEKESIKSAKAAIMSRNMSHNLGSHVMAYLKQYLGSVKDMIDKNVLSLLIPDNQEGQLNISDIKSIATTTEMPFLVGLGRFIGYLQERQDYIATVSTDYIPYVAPVNLKDAIYDELNPDLRYARHNDINDKNRPLNILLKYIAKSEGLCRCDDANYSNGRDIRIGFKGFEGGEQLPITFGMKSDDLSMTKMRQVNFGLPGGLIGRQAVFSIMENIIRNAAKHGKFNSGQGLDLVIDVIDGQEILNREYDYFRGRIGSKEVYEVLKNSSDINNLKIFTITDNLKTSAEIIEKLRSALYESYLENGKMRNFNKGIKEIRISAAWLRHETDEDKYSRLSYKDEKNELHKSVMKLKAPLLCVEMSEEGTLRYIFNVIKCTKVVVISEGFDENDEVYKKLIKLCNNSDDWKLYEQANDFLKTEYDFDRSAEFILAGSEEVYDRIRPKLSNRVIRWWNISDVQKMRIAEAVEKERESVVLSVIYQLYSGIYSVDTPIYIMDEKTFTVNKPIFEEGIKVCADERNSDIAKYVYRTHHASENDFIQYWEKKNSSNQNSYNDTKCVEGITGNDSSDRLVRREALDEKWYYMHMHALTKRIAIFDERIFSNEHKVDILNIFNENKYLNEFDGIISDYQSDLGKIKERVRNDLKGILTETGKNEIVRSYSINKLRNAVKRILSNKGEVTLRNYRSVYQYERGVDIFTIAQVNDTCYIYGCTEVGKGEDCVCKYSNIAEICSKSEDFSVDFSSDFKNRYDYISIHQGLLDKIYEYFGCKNDKDKKKKLTRALYIAFMRNNNEIGEFLPNFTIHSGRSKPAEMDMPQEQPFIQYAAIENAVKDSKFSLIEILDYARYE